MAFINNNASHNNKFSTLTSVTREGLLDNLYPERCHGKLPLPEETMNAKLMLEEKPNGAQNFKPEIVPNRKIPVCNTCNSTGAQRPRMASTWSIKPITSQRDNVDV